MFRPWKDTRRRNLRIASVVTALAVVGAAAATASAAPSTSGQVGLMVSEKADLSGAVRLTHSQVADRVFIFIESDSISRVSFHLDDATGTKAPISTSTKSPFILGSPGGAATGGATGETPAAGEATSETPADGATSGTAATGTSGGTKPSSAPRAAKPSEIAAGAAVTSTAAGTTLKDPKEKADPNTIRKTPSLTGNSGQNRSHQTPAADAATAAPEDEMPISDPAMPAPTAADAATEGDGTVIGTDGAASDGSASDATSGTDADGTAEIEIIEGGASGDATTSDSGGADSAVLGDATEEVTGTTSTTSDAGGLDTTKLKNGIHTVLAQVTSASGTVDLFARFEVKNGAADDVGLSDDSSASSENTVMATANKPAATIKKPAATGATAAIPKITGVFYKNDMEGGDGTSLAGDNHVEGGGDPAKIEKAPGGGTGNSIMFHGAPGDKRTEVYPDVPSNKPGDDKYFQFQIFFPENFQCYTDDWNIVMQWHGNDKVSPPLALDVNSKCEMIVAGNGSPGPRPSTGPIVKGKWTTYTMHIHFGEGDDGFVEAWQDGVQKVQKTNRKTMNNGSDYLKMGLYRNPSGAPDQTVYFDNLVFGTGISK